jgi:hypothetical protein
LFDDDVPNSKKKRGGNGGRVGIEWRKEGNKKNRVAGKNNEQGKKFLALKYCIFHNTSNENKYLEEVIIKIKTVYNETPHAERRGG